MDTRYLNQRGLLDEERIKTSRFVVVGAGAIGSFFVCGLSKMGARNITVYDFDSIENHNFANQMYPVSTLGLKKVDALKTLSLDYGEADIKVICEPWTPDNAVDCDVVISAVDNMDVRMVLFEYYKARCRLFVDGRMSAQVYKVFGVDTGNKEAIAYYESTLHSQADASPERCGHKSIIYTVLQVSAQMLSQIKRWLMDDYRPTGVVYDTLNDEIDKVYNMELKMEEMREETSEEVGV